MATVRPFPLWLAQLRRSGGTGTARPLTLPAPFGVGRTGSSVAHELETAIGTSWMEEGEYGDLVAAALEEPSVATLDVELPARDVLRPALTLEVPVVVARLARGWATFLPSLGLEAWGEDRQAALEAARQAVTMSIARIDAREDPRELVPIAWFDRAELDAHELALSWYTFVERRERAEAHARSRDKRVERSTSPIAAQRAFELDDVRQELRRAVHARASAGVVLVGPRGSGKTCLIADEAHAKDSAFTTPVRTTTAARLENTLTRGGPWQPELALLCAELHRDRPWLHVAGLADLFEVGRYVGNDTSLGEYLRPWLARGDIAVVAECTAEEYAQIDARYPGILEHLARVDVPAPDDARIGRVVTAWIRHLPVAAGQPAVQYAAGDEAIRLQRRFLPYAGYPGRTLRFLEAIAKDERRVSREHVTARFCEESGIPRAFVDPDVRLPHAELRARFEAALFGQPDAVDALLAVTTAVKADVAPRGRPIASLLFTGPTGVGKTEAARALATVLFGGKDRMVRFDMSEFSTPGAVLRLTTSPEPHGEGLLTGAVRRQPFAVLLLDELEKAHPDFFDLLLQLLGEGRLTDHRGRTADFCSCIVVMTSNLGAELALRQRVGLARDGSELGRELRDAVHKAFRPELVNRLDRIVPFAPLGREAVLRVLDRELRDLAAQPALADRRVTLRVTDEAKEKLAALGHDPARGARPLQRVLRDQVVARLAVQLDAQPQISAPTFEVAVRDDQIAVSLTSHGAALAPPPPFADRVAAARRESQAVLAGATLSEHAAACRMIERQARAQVEAGNAYDVDVGPLFRMRAPVGALDGVHQDLLALETRALDAALARKDGPAEAELAALIARATDAERDLFEAVHKAWNTAFLGVWCPGEGPPEAVQGWLAAVTGAAEELLIEVTRRELWSLPDGKLETTPPTEKKPGKWVGAELWLEGSAAAMLLEDLDGLWLVGRDSRARVLTGSKGAASVAGCCAYAARGVELHDEPYGPRREIWERWKSPRPDDLLRRAAYDGKPASWPPPTPTPARFAAAIRRHLMEKP
jgi:hypothetical protein